MRTVLNFKRALACALVPACTALRPADTAAPAAPGDVLVEREAFAMGTRLRIGVLAAERTRAVALTEQALGEVRRLEAVLSSWSPESEVGRINAAAPGEWVPLSAELWGLLREAGRWAERSDGAFDPVVGALIDAWDLRGEGRRPTGAERSAALAASGMGMLRFDPGRRAVARLSGAAWLDTGGFGKGAGLRAAERVLREAGARSALLDFGGQVLAIGAPAGADGWEVGVAHPSRRERPIGRFRLRDASAATTAQSERYVEVGEERFGHVLDPRTGRPVPAWGSVTVVARDALVADALSTALFVLGPDEARRWAERLDGIGVLILEERGGEVVASWNSELERYQLDLSRDTTD